MIQNVTARLCASSDVNSRVRASPLGSESSGFAVFDNAETVLAIAVPGAAEYTRKQIDELTEWVKRP